MYGQTTNGSYATFHVSFAPPPIFECGVCHARTPTCFQHPQTNVQHCQPCWNKAILYNAMENLLRTVPLPLRRKVYRALASIFHPDAGGDEELMKTLNAINDAVGP